jgi:hypothetical protein
MSEEVEESNDGTWTGLKKTIIGVLTTTVMGLGTWGVTQITGGDSEPLPVQQSAPIINITNSNTQQPSNGGTTKIIEREKIVEKPSSVPVPKKKEGDEFKEEPPKW